MCLEVCSSVHDDASQCHADHETESSNAKSLWPRVECMYHSLCRSHEFCQPLQPPPHPAAPGARSGPPPSYMGAYWGRPKHTLAVFSANDCGSCTCYTNLSCDATWARPLTAGALVTPLLSSQPRLLHLGQIAADKLKMYLLISSIIWFWAFLLAV